MVGGKYRFLIHCLSDDLLCGFEDYVEDLNMPMQTDGPNIDIKNSAKKPCGGCKEK
jgi:hypothetical protein